MSSIYRYDLTLLFLLLLFVIIRLLFSIIIRPYFLILILIPILLQGMEQFVSNFAEPGDPEYAPPVQKAETKVRYSRFFASILSTICLYSETNPGIHKDHWPCWVYLLCCNYITGYYEEELFCYHYYYLYLLLILLLIFIYLFLEWLLLLLLLLSQIDGRRLRW